jgi:hypothetical protein
MARQTRADEDEQDRQRFADRALGMLEDAMYLGDRTGARRRIGRTADSAVQHDAAG